MKNIDLSIVVPVYREATNIPPFLGRIVPILELMNVDYEIIFSLDPSPDSSAEIIENAILRNRNIKLISFSRRFGQPAATLAGVYRCSGSACVVMDVDLQDPPELIPEMYRLFMEGYQVVYAKRRSRKGETLIKLMVSYIGYALINKLSDVKIPTNTGDFRLMSRKVVDELKRLNESHGFLRGLVAFVGFEQTFIEYDRDPRFSGSGNYNRWVGSLKIGLNGLISFSARPLLIMSISGFVLAGISFLLGFWYLLQKLLAIPLTPGLSTTVLFITFFSGVQLIALGLIGEYIGRIYDEVKRRPLFIVDKEVNFEKSNQGKFES